MNNRVARKTVEYSSEERAEKMVNELEKDYVENRKSILKLLKYSLSQMSCEQLTELHELLEDYELNNPDENVVETNVCINCGEEIESTLCSSCHDDSYDENDW